MGPWNLDNFDLHPRTVGRRVGRRGRRSLGERLERLRRRWFFILQCSISAAIAWYIARDVLHHPQPFFAPVAALVALGQSYGQRIQRVLQIVVGVAIGVLVGDLIVAALGSGYAQMVFIIAAAMVLATLLDAGVLTTTQAGVQSAIVTILVASPGMAFSRWIEAVVGGIVALLAATITPATPLRRPRQHTAGIVAEMGAVFAATATSLRSGDLALAEQTLARARQTERSLATLESLADEGLSVIRSSPFRRGHLPAVQAIADLLEPLDRSIRNLRVLVRRAAIALRHGEVVPKAYIDMVAELGEIAQAMAGDLDQRTLPNGVQPALFELAERTTYVDSHPSLSSEVIRAQVRSIILDLLMVTGLSHDEAFASIPSSYSLDTEPFEEATLEDEVIHVADRDPAPTGRQPE
ncbi:FUSC family protein [Gephyromycinifex aptenodytis]|uniref:FUSC family protein n=1 Tax=Gephyromycinifex aptenodytis TaxID=2716227 RepID=UPI001D01FCD4|nr:FUSC family protein [Gephyromycinifex aptenodytis]